MIKHSHNDFLSDVYLILETIGAKVSIQAVNEPVVKTMTLSAFLALDMDRKVILNVQLPKIDPQRSLIRTYRVHIKGYVQCLYCRYLLNNFLLDF